MILPNVMVNMLGKINLAVINASNKSVACNSFMAHLLCKSFALRVELLDFSVMRARFQVNRIMIGFWKWDRRPMFSWGYGEQWGEERPFSSLILGYLAHKTKKPGNPGWL